MAKEVIQPEGNYYDKYGSKNPIVQRMMSGYFDAADQLLAKWGGWSILEAGCGEGNVSAFLRKKFPKAEIDAFDISAKVIAQAQKDHPDIHFFTADITKLEIMKNYDLTLCCEVLEHMEKPDEVISILKGTAGIFLFSVPREPIWRVLNMARGKYWKDFGNTPGHINHWSTKAFLLFLKENGLEIIDYRTPLPWTMVLCRNRESEKNNQKTAGS